MTEVFTDAKEKAIASAILGANIGFGLSESEMPFENNENKLSLLHLFNIDLNFFSNISATVHGC